MNPCYPAAAVLATVFLSAAPAASKSCRAVSEKLSVRQGTARDCGPAHWKRRSVRPIQR